MWLNFFFFNDTATTEIYTLSLHDALPILRDFIAVGDIQSDRATALEGIAWGVDFELDRKSTRLNSSHQIISYAVFCLKKKKSRLIRTRAERGYNRRLQNEVQQDPRPPD